MLTVIIPTRESERLLLPTLAALVPGAAAGIVRDVVFADAGSRDATSEIADVAGARLMTSSDPLGARLAAAADSARGDWLLFLRPGTLLGSSWITDVSRFLELAEMNDARGTAAVFSRGRASIRARSQAMEALRMLISALRGPDVRQGLLIHRRHYRELGGHRAQATDPEADLLRRIGRRHLVILGAQADSARE